MKTTIIFVISAVMLLTVSINSFAQQDTNRQGRFQKVVKEKFMEKVGIDEKTTDKFMETLQEHKEQMKKLQQKRMTVHRDIINNPSGSDVQSKLDEFLDIDYKMHLERKNFFNELKTFMTPEQIAKFISFQKDMKNFMKQNKKGKKNRGNNFNDSPDFNNPLPENLPGQDPGFLN